MSNMSNICCKIEKPVFVLHLHTMRRGNRIARNDMAFTVIKRKLSFNYGWFPEKAFDLSGTWKG